MFYNIFNPTGVKRGASGCGKGRSACPHWRKDHGYRLWRWWGWGEQYCEAQTNAMAGKVFKGHWNWLSISVNWLFSQIIPKKWDFYYFTVWKWTLKMGLLSIKFKTKYMANTNFNLSYCHILHFKPFLQKNFKKTGKISQVLALYQKKVHKQIWITLYLCCVGLGFIQLLYDTTSLSTKLWV